MEGKYSKLNTTCLLILSAVALTVALIYTKVVLVPLVFAIFAYSIISPTIHWLEDSGKLYRSLAMTVIVLLFLVVSFLLMYFVVSSIGNFLEGTVKYQNKVYDFLDWLSRQADTYEIDFEVQSIRGVLNQLGLYSIAGNVTGWVMRFLANFLLVVVIVVFLVAGESRRTIENPLYNEIQARISRYVAIKSLISLTTGILVFSVLNIFDVDLAFMFAVLTVLLNFIPSLGSIVATLLPIPVVMLQYEFGWELFVVILLLGLIQFAFGYIIEPKMMGDSMELHPITVLLCLIFWGLVWGVSGLFLAVPITAVIRIVLSRIEMTRPISELLAGRLPEESETAFEF